MREEERIWEFRVKVKTSVQEQVFVVGNCPSLGNWSNSGALQLIKETGSDSEGGATWSANAGIAKNRNVQFRYFVGIVVEPDDASFSTRHIVVRQWESNVNPRIILKGEKSDNIDIFGLYRNTRKVDRGWLTTETVVQIKLFGNAIQLWKRKFEGRKVNVKLTPLVLSRRPELVTSVEHVLEESMDTQEIPEKSDAWPVVELAVMNEKECNFHLQEQFGQPFNPTDCFIYNISMHSPESVAYLMDFFVYSSRATEQDPPLHVGFCYILPSMFIKSEGNAIVPITSSSQRPVGQLQFDYLIVKPICGYSCDMSTSYSRYWKETWHGLDVGHRGVGTSFKNEVAECADIRENTIASLKNAASAGADFVEFDVQLTKDLIPVLYHDFHVCIAMKKKKKLGEHDMLEIPLKDLTLQQLQLLKVYHLEEGKEKKERFFDEDLEEHQPFPTLRQALISLEPHVGFNVEIKWTMQLKDGTYELNHPFDLNLYLDTVLKVVLEYTGCRKIVFSCFHPDICTMLRLKQNRFPVVFLTQGVTSKYPEYRDPRSSNIPMAVYFSRSAELLGISAHTEDILRDSRQVKMVMDAGLVLFCWGDDNNNPNTIKYLKELGIHGVIYDKIDKYSSKAVKESIFMSEARLSMDVKQQSPIPSPQLFGKFEDVEAAHKLRTGIQNTASVISTWGNNTALTEVFGEGDGKSC